ncbi:MAG: alpha-L-fucosidase, partial [Candidatus Cryptobacteroides sp.]|nr:alpha-L-fucosidase [Candidatus Cryptobacteroides sp.]
AFSLFLSVICFAQLPVTERKLEEFKDLKLGLFLHWGLYSQAGGDWQGGRYKGGEHFMLYERIPLKEYATLAGEFNPYLFDADRWVEDAMHAGMKYLVITTKHHEGFAMFDSKCSNYTLKAFDEGDRIRSVRLLSGKRRVKWNISSKGLDIHLDSPADHDIYVLKIKLKKSNQ